MTDSIVTGGIGLMLIFIGMFLGSVFRDWLNNRQIKKYGNVTVVDTVYTVRKSPEFNGGM